ncbi:MAG: type II secretion system protein [Verrucomicrobiota bacterium JB024]|nr:type II secretion system protein [Verrucomicrobiota bacterium JB024]
MKSKRAQKYPYRRMAFTLIEVLAVLALIAVLAAILLPAFSRIREKTMAVNCTSNMRQIGASMLLYVNEHGGRLPGPLWPEQGVLYRSSGGQVVEEGHLVAYLVPYFDEPPQADGVANARNIDAFLCPAWMASKGFDESEVVGAGIPYQSEIRYFGHKRSNPDLQTEPRMLVDVPDPARIAAIFETDAQDGTYYGNTGNYRLADSPVHESFRHYLFFDGSVRAVSLEDQAHQQELQRRTY